MEDVYYPELDSLIKKLTRMADEWRDVSMLAKTHGQPASPTRLGKEIMVFVSRLNQQLTLLRMVIFSILSKMINFVPSFLNEKNP